MARIWIALVVLLGLVVAGAILIPDQDEDIASNGAELEQTRENPSLPALEIERSEFAPPTEGLPEPRYGDPVEGGILVTVVDGITGERLPGAEVLVIDPEMGNERDQELEFEFVSGLDLRWMFDKHGLIYKTDEQAQVRIPEQPKEVFLAGRTDKFFSVQTLPYAESLTLSLTPPTLIAVEVVDLQGNPVENAPVAIRARSYFGPASMIKASTDADGKANLEVVDLLRMISKEDSLTSSFIGETDFYVALEVLTPTPVEAWISLDRLPTTPIQLVMPECGQVGVEVLDKDGVRSTKKLMISLSLHDPSKAAEIEAQPLLQEQIGEYLVKTTSKGAARFPAVAFDQQLQARVVSQDEEFTATLVSAGPVRDGGLVVLRMRPEGPFPSFSGRIVNTEGVAAPKLKFQTRLRRKASGKDSRESGELQTDADGRFLMTLDHQPVAADDLQWTITLAATRKKPARSVTVDLGGCLEVQQHELGDLVIGELSFLASGRVLDPDGSPLGGAYVSAESIDLDRELIGGEIWARTSAMTSTNAQGYFILRGNLDDARHRVKVENYEFFPATLEFAIGAKDLELQMGQAWDVMGRFILDKDIDATELDVILSDAGHGVHGRDYSQYERLSMDGTFQFDEQSVGRKTLSLRSHANILYSEEIPLGPTGGQMELEPIDLTGQFYSIVLHVKDEDGEYVYGAWAASTDEETLGWSSGDPMVILAKTPSLDMKVSAKDYGLVHLKDVSGEREVILPAGHRVKLVVDNAPNLRMSYGVMVFLTPVAGEAEVELNPNQGSILFLGPPFGGATTVPLPGIYEVEAMIVDLGGAATGSDHKVPVGDGSNPVTIEVLDQATPQIIHLTLNQRDLDEAVEQMTKLMR
jgi:hypothetical protein